VVHGFSRAGRALVGERRDLDGRELGGGAGERDRLVLVRGLAAGADRADDLAVDDERDAAGERGHAVERERAEPSVRDLLFHDAARAAEGRGGARLVYGAARGRASRAGRGG